MTHPKKLLKESGWTLARNKKHEVWKCPCGKHTVTVYKTPSDHRNRENLMSDIMKTGCPSLDAPEEEPPSPKWPPGSELKCLFCGRELDPEEKDFCYHDGTFACFGHPGIRDWHREECRKERKANKAS
jgi:hypothetical protein